MSLIVYNRIMTTLYADSLVSNSGFVPGEMVKIKVGWSVQHNQAFMMAVSGMARDISAYFNYFINDDRPMNKLSSDCLLITEKSGVYLYEGSLHPVYVPDNRAGMSSVAIGSGAPFALGALSAGAGIDKAFKIAAQFDLHTGGAVRYCEKDALKQIDRRDSGGDGRVAIGTLDGAIGFE